MSTEVVESAFSASEPVLRGDHAASLDEIAAGPTGPKGGRVTGAAMQADRIQALIEKARSGSPAAIGQLVEKARGFLLLTASRHLPGRLHHKVGASDIVQETALEVQQGFAGFNGSTEAELFGWMRQVLLHNVADAIRHYEGTAKRDATRERAIDHTAAVGTPDELRSRKRTPDESVMGHEDAALVAEILVELSPHYREVLHLRYWEQCSYIEIGLRMNRSPDAARKLWYRALDQFNTALADRRLQAQTATARPR